MILPFESRFFAQTFIIGVSKRGQVLHNHTHNGCTASAPGQRTAFNEFGLRNLEFAFMRSLFKRQPRFAAPAQQAADNIVNIASTPSKTASIARSEADTRDTFSSYTAAAAGL